MPENEDTVEVSDVVKKPRPKKVEYRARVGLSYGDVRVEAGEVANDIPEESLEWLLEGNYIEKVK